MPRSVLNSSMSEPLVLSNPLVTDSIGRSLIGVEGTKYLSGSSLAGSTTPEIREILICPGVDCGVDSSHSPVVYFKVGEAGAPINSPWSNTIDLFCQLGSWVAQATNEAFLHDPARSIPEGWCVFAYKVYVSIRLTVYRSVPQGLNTLQTVFLSRTHKNNINNSVAKAEYLALYHDADDLINSLQTFANNTSWNPNIGNSSYGIIWIATTNN